MPTNNVYESGEKITVVVQDQGNIIEVGVQGPPGLIGPPGIGIQGPEGAQGIQGIQGIPGTGAVVQDSTPLVGQLGELWFNTTTKVLTVYDNTTWQNQSQDDGYF